MAPRHVAAAARELAAIDGVSVEVEGREGLQRARDGLLRRRRAGRRRGAGADHAALRAPRRDAAPCSGLVGKAVTFDTGGISIKPANKMFEMKFDMSGGAAVLGAVEAIAAPEAAGARRRRRRRDGEHALAATRCAPATSSRRPTALTVEIINTDAEGRLVLADCLAHAIAEGAERLIDIATLTGAIITALGNAHAGVIGDDDDWVGAVTAAGTSTGELVWRLPLHADYAKALESETADLMNVNETRKAGSCVGGAVPQPLHRRRAVGAPRHRRHRLGRGAPLRPQGRQRLRRAPDGPGRALAERLTRRSHAAVGRQ